ncbi:retropepsin-like aspartic protease family protein [Rubrimonas cliftonensis]|uniref:Aspartyl protease family protein n=1 Tax=Rubrimonas cliftonensis TaxID=89524 RepID=A0A1H3XD83_9RHOB|nr:TIGR02281 family clan AA aspartic protease [Rubrimonas cliftonensis]SDZ97190.1 aspartyl protease family protein [Rubrimonas cliftonensis]
MSGDETARLVYLAGLLVLVCGGLFAAYGRRMGEALRHAAIWALIFLAAIVLYGFRDIIGAQLSSAPVMAVTENAAVLRRGPNGHFRASGSVNGASVDFLIDTGATEIVLSRADAARAGLDPDRLAYTRPANTANGVVYGAPVRLERLAIGPFDDRDVAAVVNGGELSTSLLGIRWLDRFARWRVEGDRMVLER